MDGCRIYSIHGTKPYENMVFEYVGVDPSRRYSECLDEIEEESKALKYYELIDKSLARNSECINESMYENVSEKDVIEAMEKCKTNFHKEKDEIYSNFAKRLEKIMNY